MLLNSADQYAQNTRVKARCAFEASVISTQITHSHTRRPARGWIAVEFLAALPVALGMVCAIAEFGILLAKVQYVEMAAFEGASDAAQLDERQSYRAAEIGRVRANRVLREAGLGDACAVVVRQQSRGKWRFSTTNRDCRCDSPPLPRHMEIDAVQCTVCVPMSQLTPDLLALIGFSTRDRIVSASHTVPRLSGSRRKLR